MQRREALKTIAALSLGAAANAAGPRPKHQLGLVIHSYWVRGAKPLEPDFPAISDPLAFVEYAARVGAAGVQTRIAPRDGAALAQLQETVARHGMYLEGTIALPKDDADLARFETEVLAAKAAGAAVLRTVCMSGRRYEVFNTLDAFQEFTKKAWKSLTLAEPIAARHQVQLAVENHKDWRVEEMLAWLKRLSSEYVGVCLDTGNSIALLEDPHAVVEAYAPWTMTTHLKDMGLAESADGFLLSEVPLGEGYLDLPRVVATIRKARPSVRWNLEMITRDPLRIPCLTSKYWATMPDVRAQELAAALARTREHKFPGPLPVVSNLPHRQQLQAEADNAARCFAYFERKLSVRDSGGSGRG